MTRTKKSQQTSNSTTQAPGFRLPSLPLEALRRLLQIVYFVESVSNSSRGSLSSSTYRYCLGISPFNSYSSNGCTISKHVKTHSRDFPCPISTCNRSFYRARDVERHVSTRHSTKEEKNNYFCKFRHCEYASKGFSRNDNLMRHVRLQHRGGPRGRPDGSPCGGLDVMQQNI